MLKHLKLCFVLFKRSPVLQHLLSQVMTVKCQCNNVLKELLQILLWAEQTVLKRIKVTSLNGCLICFHRTTVIWMPLIRAKSRREAYECVVIPTGPHQSGVTTFSPEFCKYNDHRKLIQLIQDCLVRALSNSPPRTWPRCFQWAWSHCAEAACSWCWFPRSPHPHRNERTASHLWTRSSPRLRRRENTADCQCVTRQYRHILQVICSFRDLQTNASSWAEAEGDAPTSPKHTDS